MSQTLFEKDPQLYSEAHSFGDYYDDIGDTEYQEDRSKTPAPFGALPLGSKVLVPAEGTHLQRTTYVKRYLEKIKRGAVASVPEREERLIEKWEKECVLEERTIVRAFTDGVCWRTYWRTWCRGREIRDPAYESLSMLSHEIKAGLSQPHISMALQDHPEGDQYGNWRTFIELRPCYETLNENGRSVIVDADMILGYQDPIGGKKWCIAQPPNIWVSYWGTEMQEYGLDFHQHPEEYPWESFEFVKDIANHNYEEALRNAGRKTPAEWGGK